MMVSSIGKPDPLLSKVWLEPSEVTMMLNEEMDEAAGRSTEKP